MPLVFVYGSLKAGFQNAHVNSGMRQPGVFRTCQRLPMFLLGEGHVPCLLLAPGSGHQVLGEVYEVTEDGLAAMDRLERLGEANGYLRIAIEVEAIDGKRGSPLAVNVYAKQPDQVGPKVQRVGPLAEYTAGHAARFKW